VTGPAWLAEVPLVAEGPPWLAMGLGRITDDLWLLPDERREIEVVERRRLLAERHHDVVAALPGTEAAGAEVLDLVQAWERRHRPDLAAEVDSPDGSPLGPCCPRSASAAAWAAALSDSHSSFAST